MQDILVLNGTVRDFSLGKISLDEAFRSSKEALDSGSSVEIVYQDAWGTKTIRQITLASLNFGWGEAIIGDFLLFPIKGSYPAPSGGDLVFLIQRYTPGAKINNTAISSSVIQNGRSRNPKGSPRNRMRL